MKKIKLQGKEEEVILISPDNYGNSSHWEMKDGTPFDGHFVLWGFSYEPKTYLKESEWSGDEWQKGGTIKYFKDGQQVFEQFCRTSEHAVKMVMDTLPKLQDLNWDMIKEGTKIYWKDTPATIGYIMLEQGCMMLHAETEFPNPPWAKEDWQKLEDNKEVKVEFLDPHIWWWRD